MDAVTHCHIEFDREPGICTSVARPFCSFTEIEQTIIDNEVEKILLKGIIRLSSHEDGQVISPIFKPKKDGSHRVIFNLKKLNESVTYHHFKMDIYRSEGCILLYPYCRRTSEIFKIYLEGSIICFH